MIDLAGDPEGMASPPPSAGDGASSSPAKVPITPAHASDGPPVPPVPPVSIDVPALARYCVRHAVHEYGMEPHGIHGAGHWARVMENGLRLASRTHANPRVVQAFAVLHDCCRLHDGTDPEHGPRAAEFAATVPRSILPLTAAELAFVVEACADHARGWVHADVTVMTCWDADRLDLGRVGTRPDPERLCTGAAREPDMIRWAHDRALEEHVPSMAAYDWNLDDFG